MAKASTGSKYYVAFSTLRSALKKEVPSNMLLFTGEKILYDELLDIIKEKFLGKNYDAASAVTTFYSDEADITTVLGECDGTSFFAAKKIIVYKIVKKTGSRGINKENREYILKYFRSPNPDTVFIIYNGDKEFTFSFYEDFEGSNAKIFIVRSGDEAELIKWIKDKFDDYEISQDVIVRLLQFVNPSYDEIYSEIEKLKLYCTDTKKITLDDVNCCVGLSKDFHENQLFEAILRRDFESAIKIYENMSAKHAASSSEVELKFLYYMDNLFISLHKLADPKLSKMPEGDTLYRMLNLWRDSARMLRLYKEYLMDANELKIKKAFDYIYNTDKALKNSQQDKHILINNLIHNLVNL